MAEEILLHNLNACRNACPSMKVREAPVVAKRKVSQFHSQFPSLRSTIHKLAKQPKLGSVRCVDSGDYIALFIEEVIHESQKSLRSTGHILTETISFNLHQTDSDFWEPNTKVEGVHERRFRTIGTSTEHLPDATSSPGPNFVRFYTRSALARLLPGYVSHLKNLKSAVEKLLGLGTPHYHKDMRIMNPGCLEISYRYNDQLFPDFVRLVVNKVHIDLSSGCDEDSSVTFLELECPCEDSDAERIPFWDINRKVLISADSTLQTSSRYFISQLASSLVLDGEALSACSRQFQNPELYLKERMRKSVKQAKLLSENPSAMVGLSEHTNQLGSSCLVWKPELSQDCKGLPCFSPYFKLRTLLPVKIYAQLRHFIEKYKPIGDVKLLHWGAKLSTSIWLYCSVDVDGLTVTVQQNRTWPSLKPSSFSPRSSAKILGIHVSVHSYALNTNKRFARCSSPMKLYARALSVPASQENQQSPFWLQQDYCDSFDHNQDLSGYLCHIIAKTKGSASSSSPGSSLSNTSTWPTQRHSGLLSNFLIGAVNAPSTSTAVGADLKSWGKCTNEGERKGLTVNVLSETGIKQFVEKPSWNVNQILSLRYPLSVITGDSLKQEGEGFAEAEIPAPQAKRMKTELFPEDITEAEGFRAELIMVNEDCTASIAQSILGAKEEAEENEH